MGGRGAVVTVPISPADATQRTNYSSFMNINEPKSMREALGERGKSISIANSFMQSNPYYSKAYADFSMNCQRCVVAYEARRRGYDVVAQPRHNNDKLAEVAYFNKDGSMNGRWQGAFKGARTKSMADSTPEAVVKNINRTMREYGNGSRGVISILWKGGGGHVFNVENKGGSIFYVDAQTGHKYNGVNVISLGKLNSIGLIRVDNLRFTSRVTNFVEQRGVRSGTKKGK